MRDFALSCDIDPNTMLAYAGAGKRKASKPNSVALQKIVLTTKCNAHWLLTGEGNTYLDPKAEIDPPSKKVFKFPNTDNEIRTIFEEFRFIPKLPLSRMNENQVKERITYFEISDLRIERLAYESEEYIKLANNYAKSFHGVKARKVIKEFLMYSLTLMIILNHKFRVHPTALRLLPFLNYILETKVDLLNYSYWFKPLNDDDDDDEEIEIDLDEVNDADDKDDPELDALLDSI